MPARVYRADAAGTQRRADDRPANGLAQPHKTFRRRRDFSGVTIEQLLNHTSGVPRGAEAGLATQPGTAFAYSNTGYMLLGALVEKVSGKPYGVALHDEMAAPLGLTTLTRCGDPKPGEAIAYGLSAGKIAPPPGMHHSQLLGAGGICTTAVDLIRWRDALHRGRVVSANSYAAMTTPRGAAVSGNYGFGLYARPAPWGDMAIVNGGPTTVLFALGLTVLSSAIAGVMPALKVTRGMGARLKQATAGAGGLQCGGIWTVVIVVQVAFTIVRSRADEPAHGGALFGGATLQLGQQTLIHAIVLAAPAGADGGTGPFIAAARSPAPA